ncbi:MAG: L,D-transpeptidase Cds6 family protein [Pyrinomonadaceae bacterium]
MKICPHCQTRYTDDTLQFCLQDGAALASADEQTSMPTAAFNDEQETVVKSRPDKIEFDLQNSRQSQNWQQPATSGETKYQTEARKSNMGLIIATTVLATILIFGTGVAAWFYFGKDSETAKDANVKNSFPDNSAKNKTENSEVFPPENTDEKPSVRPTLEQNPAPNFDAEQVKADVSKTVYAWKSAAETTDLTEYMTHYADRLDYYNKRGASLGTVRADKQKAFSTYDTIKINLSNMRVTPDTTGENATAVFDKEWYFENDSKTSEGKVQSRLKLKNVGGAWKITGERDLRVYYVN